MSNPRPLESYFKNPGRLKPSRHAIYRFQRRIDRVSYEQAENYLASLLKKNQFTYRRTRGQAIYKVFINTRQYGKLVLVIHVEQNVLLTVYQARTREDIRLERAWIRSIRRKQRRRVLI